MSDPLDPIEEAFLNPLKPEDMAELASMIARAAGRKLTLRVELIEMPESLALVEEVAATAAPDCVNPRHDHTGQIEAADNGTGFNTGNDWLVCGDCRAPMHYDETIGDYRHDNPDAELCFLIQTKGDGEPCVPAPS